MHRKIGLVLGLGSLFFLTACGLRLDIDASSEPELDAQEVIRTDAIADLRQIKELAHGLLNEVETDENAVQVDDPGEFKTLLGDIGAQTDLHLELLGADAAGEAGARGEDTSDSDEDQDGSEEEEEEPAADQGPSSITVRALRTAVGTTALDLTEATTKTEGQLARLLGSIAVALNSWDTDIAMMVPAADSDSEEADADAGAVTPEEAALAAIPRLIDLNDPATDWVSAIGAFDRVGYLLEITAARSSENQDALRKDALAFRDRAEQWARALGVAGGDDDPRLVSYSSPKLSGEFADDVEALRDEVRASLAEINFTLGDLIYSLPAEQRPTAVVELMEMRSDNERFAVAAANMPGLREHAQ